VTPSINLFTLKILSAVAIIVVGLIGGMIPIVARRSENSRRFFSLGNAFAGGVFLGAGLIHLLPDGTRKLATVSTFPIGGLLAVLGFALLLLIDRVLFSHHDLTASAERSSSTYPYVLTVILSVHSIIAGTSLGLETHVTTSIVILLAILFHKGSAAFALMVSLHNAGVPSARQKRILSLFVMMTPLGLLIGSVASAVLSGNRALLLEGSFDALAAGTFLYVAVIDIIDEELSIDEDKLAKFTLITLGVTFMALLAVWA
jgi:zinc transporter 1/2/3